MPSILSIETVSTRGGSSNVSGLGKDPTHSKSPMKVVFKPGQEDWTEWGNPDTVTGHRVRVTVLRIRENLRASQQKMYKAAWEEADQRSGSEKVEGWILIDPKSKPSIGVAKKETKGREEGEQGREERNQASYIY
jgi:hypothetical protein